MPPYNRTYMSVYPFFADIKDMPVVVIGGGKVAARKVESLLESTADVYVIALSVSEELQSLAQDRRITLRLRAYTYGDLEGFLLAFAATDNKNTNEMVAEEARKRGILVNRIDGGLESGGFIVPSVIKRGPLAVAFSTGGIPFFTKRVKEYFQRKLYPELAEELEELRNERLQICDDTTLSGLERRDKIEQSLSGRTKEIIEKIERL